MKKGLLLALFLMIIVAAKCNNQDVGEYFNRPDFRQCITLEERGLMACNGVVKDIEAGKIIMEDFISEDEMEDYFTDKELRLYICLRFPKRCK